MFRQLNFFQIRKPSKFAKNHITLVIGMNWYELSQISSKGSVEVVKTTTTTHVTLR